MPKPIEHMPTETSEKYIKRKKIAHLSTKDRLDIADEREREREKEREESQLSLL
jgi:hypothetical protein